MTPGVDARGRLFAENDDMAMVIPLDGGEQTEEAIDAGKNRFYGFHLGNIGLLLDKGVHREVLEGAVVAPIPLMPQTVLGLCNVRGNLVPIINLHQIFGFEVNRLDLNKVRLLVLEEGENMVGIVVQEMLNVWKFEDFDRVENIPAVHHQLDDHVTFCYQKDGSYWFGFNHISLIQSALRNS